MYKEFKYLSLNEIYDVLLKKYIGSDVPFFKEFMIKLMDELKSKNSTIEVDKKQVTANKVTSDILKGLTLDEIKTNCVGHIDGTNVISLQVVTLDSDGVINLGTSAYNGSQMYIKRFK